jgi:aminopeptidase-like protein
MNSSVSTNKKTLSLEVGPEMHQLVSRLFPINRSLTGDGVRETLNILREYLPTLKTIEVPTGTRCFDWEVPQEWRVNRAFIIDPLGNKICDFAENNLHLVGYSRPISKTMSLGKLLPHLHSLPELPSAIPYTTSYYRNYWGFCLSDEQKERLIPGEYQVIVDTELFDGSLTYGELFIAGKSTDEVLVSTYICHPSMANDELSGPVVATFAAKWAQARDRRLSYRFVFVPETIGAIAFLNNGLEQLKQRVIAGFNLSCIGDDRDYSMVASRKGNTLADKVAAHVLKHIASDFKKYSFLERGSDERQYCSPGIDLPLCTLCRTKFGKYPEYHTSLDDLNLVTPSGLAGGLDLLVKCLECLESNQIFQTTVGCEPQLGKRGLYPNLSVSGNGETVRDLTNLIAYCDGSESLLEIADRLNRPIWSFFDSLGQLLQNGLINLADNTD